MNRASRRSVSSGARNEKNALKVKESRRSSEGRRCTPLSSVSGSPSNRCHYVE